MRSNTLQLWYSIALCRICTFSLVHRLRRATHLISTNSENEHDEENAHAETQSSKSFMFLKMIDLGILSSARVDQEIFSAITSIIAQTYFMFIVAFNYVIGIFRFRQHFLHDWKELRRRITNSTWTTRQLTFMYFLGFSRYAKSVSSSQMTPDFLLAAEYE